MEFGTYKLTRDKITKDTYGVQRNLHHTEGGLSPMQWRMNIICTTRSQLASLKTSYEKVTYDNRAITFTDKWSQSRSVYFTSMGPETPIGITAMHFRVPIVLTETAAI